MVTKTKSQSKSKSGARSHKSASSPVSRKPVKSVRWSAKVMQHSDAMDLEPGVFKLRSPVAVARSLKRSSEASPRRKSSPFRSAMSMLNFEINRAGTNLTDSRRRVLNRAKEELRKLFGRSPTAST